MSLARDIAFIGSGLCEKYARLGGPDSGAGNGLVLSHAESMMLIASISDWHERAAALEAEIAQPARLTPELLAESGGKVVALRHLPRGGAA